MNSTWRDWVVDQNKGRWSLQSALCSVLDVIRGGAQTDPIKGYSGYDSFLERIRSDCA